MDRTLTSTSDLCIKTPKPQCVALETEPLGGNLSPGRTDEPSALMRGQEKRKQLPLPLLRSSSPLHCGSTVRWSPTTRGTFPGTGELEHQWPAGSLPGMGFTVSVTRRIFTRHGVHGISDQKDFRQAWHLQHHNLFFWALRTECLLLKPLNCLLFLKQTWAKASGN